MQPLKKFRLGILFYGLIACLIFSFSLNAQAQNTKGVDIKMVFKLHGRTVTSVCPVPDRTVDGCCNAVGTVKYTSNTAKRCCTSPNILRSYGTEKSCCPGCENDAYYEQSEGNVCGYCCTSPNELFTIGSTTKCCTKPPGAVVRWDQTEENVCGKYCNKANLMSYNGNSSCCTGCGIGTTRMGQESDHICGICCAAGMEGIIFSGLSSCCRSCDVGRSRQTTGNVCGCYLSYPHGMLSSDAIRYSSSSGGVCHNELGYPASFPTIFGKFAGYSCCSHGKFPVAYEGARSGVSYSYHYTCSDNVQIVPALKKGNSIVLAEGTIGCPAGQSGVQTVLGYSNTSKFGRYSTGCCPIGTVQKTMGSAGGFTVGTLCCSPHLEAFAALDLYDNKAGQSWAHIGTQTTYGCCGTGKIAVELPVTRYISLGTMCCDAGTSLAHAYAPKTSGWITSSCCSPGYYLASLSTSRYIGTFCCPVGKVATDTGAWPFCKDP